MLKCENRELLSEFQFPECQFPKYQLPNVNFPKCQLPKCQLFTAYIGTNISTCTANTIAITILKSKPVCVNRVDLLLWAAMATMAVSMITSHT